MGGSSGEGRGYSDLVNLRRLLLVALGGALGSAARLGTSLSLPDIAGIPVATLAVNIVGAFLMGVLAARIPGSSDLRVFLGTGILGGFTTYSAFAEGAVAMTQPVLALGYVLVSLVGGIAAAALGLLLAGGAPPRTTPGEER